VVFRPAYLVLDRVLTWLALLADPNNQERRDPRARPRQEVAALRRHHPRPKPSCGDRTLLSALSRLPPAGLRRLRLASPSLDRY
jgi:hypothetical protein